MKFSPSSQLFLKEQAVGAVIGYLLLASRWGWRDAAVVVLLVYVLLGGLTVTLLGVCWLLRPFTGWRWPFE